MLLREHIWTPCHRPCQSCLIGGAGWPHIFSVAPYTRSLGSEEAHQVEQREDKAFEDKGARKEPECQRQRGQSQRH